LLPHGTTIYESYTFRPSPSNFDSYERKVICWNTVVMDCCFVQPCA
jgi:hypothetical protein